MSETDISPVLDAEDTAPETSAASGSVILTRQASEPTPQTSGDILQATEQAIEQISQTSGEILQATEQASGQTPQTSGETSTPPASELTPLASEQLPKASEEGLAYLQSVVSQTDLKKLMFEDHLVTVSDTGKDLGVFSVTMDPTRRRGQSCFLVHARSHGAVDGVPCGTSIVCHVSGELETLEQSHHEYVKLEHYPIDRQTFITKEGGKYMISKIVTRGKEVKTSNHTFSLDTMKGFISEGSNLLLHRIFIDQGLPEDLHFLSFDSEVNLCPTVYRSLAERTQKVEEVELRVFGVERTIDSSVDLPTIWQSYLTEDGHLTNRVQIGSPVTMTLQKLPRRKDMADKPPKPVFEKKELDWEEDLQMFSKFLDRKEELKNSHTVFLRHHPELRALLADFLQFLLLKQPTDVLAFSADYFAAFSRTTSYSSPYLASALPSRYPQCRTNKHIEALRVLRLEKE